MKLCKLFLLVLTTGVFCGCLNLSQLARPGVKTSYYTLAYEPAAVTDEKLPYVLKVKRFTATPLFSSKKIIYKEKDFQTNEYLYHQWHVVPAESVSYLLARDMRQSGLFTAVFGPSSAVAAPFSIGGNLEMFLEDNNRQPWEAVLSVEIRLTDETEPDVNQSILLQKLYTAAEPCARDNPRATAEAMSRAMQTISAQILKDVYDIIKEGSSPD